MSVNVIVPDIGTEEAAEVVEICVAVGDTVEAEQSIIVLETDKASVEVPSSHTGVVTAILVSEGDQIKMGDTIMSVDSASGSDSNNQGETPEEDLSADRSKDVSVNEYDEQQTQAVISPVEATVSVPDLGGASDVDVIEVCVSVGDEVEEGDSLIVLETDKASLDVPSPYAGVLISLAIKEGDKVKEGEAIGVLQTGSSNAEGTKEIKSENPQQGIHKEDASQINASQTNNQQTSVSKTATPVSTHNKTTLDSVSLSGKGDSAYAGPAVRKLARQLGVDLSKVKASGPRNRCTKEDLRTYVKNIVAGKNAEGSGIPPVPAVDFAKFGEVKKVKLTKIKRATAANMHRSWLNVPHVTQFDDADITDLETFRKSQKQEAEKRGVKLSPVPFLIKACALALQKESSFNVSLDPDGQHIYEKNYVHIGMAVDTPTGLVVPVIRDVDKKSIWDIAADVSLVAGKARDGKLTPKEMQGGCFTISSLGAIGGQGFTPIVNTPEVGILGVSKATVKPFWDGKVFIPKHYLPLSLSYDHRAVNGADAGKFLTYLVDVLADHNVLMDACVEQ
ncbi:MAG: dihydrolipoyllysine-residue acetyltransferase [Cellvibrionaceae bacterium]